MSPRPVRVLIAVSDPRTRRSVADVVAEDDNLELAGATGSAAEALASAASTAIDVALVDPWVEGGGTQLTEALRRTPRSNGHLGIVAYAATVEPDVVIGMLRAGAIGYLSAHTAAEEIVAALHDAAGGRATVSPAAVPAVVDELMSHLRARDHLIDEERARLARVRRVLDEELVEAVFQPIVSVSTRSVDGYEALARFSAEPQRPPNEWFAEAWSVGLGAELEELAARVALMHLDALPEATYLAVNVSPGLIASDNLHHLIHAVDAERVVVEMTEHIAVEDYDRLTQWLEPIRSGGARLSVDDTGAGFASLRHILSLRPEFIKLDHSITRHIDADIARIALARGLVSFAVDIDAHIIGEGVETEAELDALRQLGVPGAQGYLFGRPGPLPT